MALPLAFSTYIGYTAAKGFEKIRCLGIFVPADVLRRCVKPNEAVEKPNFEPFPPPDS